MLWLWNPLSVMPPCHHGRIVDRPDFPPGGGKTFADAGCDSFDDLIHKANIDDGEGCIRFTDNYCESVADASIPEIQLCDTPIAFLSFTR